MLKNTATGIVIVFDADNTLWDTFTVHQAAQYRMIKTLEVIGFVEHPDSYMDIIRKIDRVLTDQLKYVEYDSRLLSLAFIYYLKANQPIDDVANLAINTLDKEIDPELNEMIEKSSVEYKAEIINPPKLYPDTIPILDLLRSWKTQGLPIVTILFSEGSSDRVERIINSYEIMQSNYFDEIVFANKCIDSFTEVKHSGIDKLKSETRDTLKNINCIVVGDSLQRDVVFGNLSGFITIYKPSRYWGLEVPQNRFEEPCFTISSFDELPAIIKKFSNYPANT